MPPKKGKTSTPPPFAQSRKVIRSPTQEDHHSPTSPQEYDCRSCDKPNSAGNMVQCDRCPAWHHYACVNVDSYISEDAWECPMCEGKNCSLTNSLSKAPPVSTAEVVANKAETTAKSTGAIRKNPAPNIAANPPPTTISGFPIAGPRSPPASNVESTSIAVSAPTTTVILAIDAENRSAAREANNVLVGKGIDFDSAHMERNPVGRDTVAAGSALTATTINRDSAIGPIPVKAAQVTSLAHASLSPFAPPFVTGGCVLGKDIAASTNNLVQTNQNLIPLIEHRRSSRVSSCSRSSKSSSTRRIQLELQKLEEERCLAEKREQEEMERRKKRDSEYLSRKYEMLTQLQESESEGDENPEKKLKVNCWLGKSTWNRMQSTAMVSTGTSSSLPQVSSFQHCKQSTAKPPSAELPICKKTSFFNALPIRRPDQHQNQSPAVLTSTNIHELNKPTTRAVNGAEAVSAAGHQSKPQQHVHENACDMVAALSQPILIHQQQPFKSSASQIGGHLPTTANEPPVNAANRMEATAHMSSQPNQTQTVCSDGTGSHPSNNLELPQPAHHSSPTEIVSHILSRNQIASRHLTRELHPFGGNPLDWPLFISDFNRTTDLCGFNNEENLVRLNRALKGEALNAVRSLLLQPNCVQQVISTLKMLYGRPEIIIHTQLQKIRTTPPPKAEKLESIVAFALAVPNLAATIEASGLMEHLNNPTLMQELVDKLPPAIRLSWAIYKQTLPSPTCCLSQFSKWIYQMAEAASGVLIPLTSCNFYEAAHSGRSAKGKGYTNVHCETTSENGFINAHYEGAKEADNEAPSVCVNRCYVCGGKCTSVAKCTHFQKLNRSERWSEVRKHRLCRRCLIRHIDNKCTSTSVCGVSNCTFKHHRLLHNDQRETRNSIQRRHNDESDERTQQDKPVEVTEHPRSFGTVGLHSLNGIESQHINPILFRIVPVVLFGTGIKIRTLAFLDDGSSLTLMNEELAGQLKAGGTPQPLCIKWTGNTSRIENDSKVFNIENSSTAPGAERYALTDVHTVKNLNLPPQSLNSRALQKRYPHLRGLTVECYSKGVPRLLIGLNNAKLGLPLKSKEGGATEPVATKTRLGWVVHGIGSVEPRLYQSIANEYSFHVCECNDLLRLTKNFICADNFGGSIPSKLLMSTEDSRALDTLKAHTVRKNGRFETALLWRFDQFQLPNSLPMARRRLECLQRRMRREPDLEESLNRKIAEYVSKGYARKLSSEEITERKHRSWYLPIFPVKNPNKSGKLRIVWDAAAAVQGISLNSMLLKGPDQLTSLTSVIFKFRENKVAICGDIMEMFHQVRIREEDQHFQRFLWSNNEGDNIDTYVLMVMTFGATCSPCAAQFVKNTNAEHFAQQFPRAVRAIKDNHYVDDLMDSLPTEAEAIKLAKEIRNIHRHTEPNLVVILIKKHVDLKKR